MSRRDEILREAENQAGDDPEAVWLADRIVALEAEVVMLRHFEIERDKLRAGLRNGLKAHNPLAPNFCHCTVCESARRLLGEEPK